MTHMNDGSLDLVALAQKLLKTFTGYIAAIVIGFLFIIIVPIVGCCFCCCRLCGNCGGKNIQAPSDNLHCKRRIFSSILFAMTIFIFVGNICTYVSNDRMSTALDEISNTVDNNLDDIDTFLQQVEDQIVTVGVVNMNKTKQAILGTMDAENMADSLSEFVLNDLSSGALDKMQTNLQRVTAAADRLNTEVDNIEKAFTSSGVTPNPGTKMKSDLSNFTVQFNSFKTQDPIKEVKTDLKNNVKSKLNTSISSSKTSIKTSFDAMEAKVKEAVDKIKEFRSDTKGELNVESIKAKVKSYTDSAHEYDKYRHTGGAVLGAAITLIVSLQVLGIVFGTLGQGLKTEPANRGCVSNSGGNMLIASVAFIFLFSALLMLLTTLSFSVGALLERFICQPLADPDLKLLKVSESMFPGMEKTIGAPISKVMSDCRDGKAAYTAFHLETRFNITEIDGILKEKEKDIDRQMNTTFNNLNAVSGNSDYTKKATDSFKNLEDAFSILPFTLLHNLANTPGLPANGLHDVIVELEVIKSAVPNWKSDFVTGMSTAQKSIGQQLGEKVKAFQHGVLEVAHRYVRTTKSAITDQVGQCTPVWNLYHSIVVVSLCQYTVDAFNGFWFSIGWCLFFFMPSLVFSVKLAKHYRTMASPDEENAYESNNHLFKSNKVGHADGAAVQ